MKIIINFFKHLINLGVNYNSITEADIRVQMINRVALISAIFAVCYTTIFILFGSWFQGGIMCSFFFAFSSILYFNHKKKYRIAKLLQIVLSNIGIFYFSYSFGWESGIHLFVILSPIFNISILPAKQHSSIILATAMYFLTFCLLAITKEHTPFFTLSEFQLKTMYYTVIAFIIILTGVLFYYLKNTTDTYINELLDKNDNLKVEVELRKISEERVQQQHYRLKDSYNTLEHFSYIISHNLRGPIANLIGLTDLFNNNNNSKIIIEHIQESVKRLDSVIKDLNGILDLKQSNVKEGRQEVDIYKEIQTVISIIKIHEDSSIKISLDLKFNELYCIKSFINNILYNLISNSIKYRKENIDCEISIKTDILDDNKFQMIYEDNGIGIDLKKYGSKIFKMYNRFHRVSEGKGLGLYLVKNQIQLLEGSIEVESEPNNGTKFIIELPAELHR